MKRKITEYSGGIYEKRFCKRYKDCFFDVDGTLVDMKKR